jgi:hypothetical protein
MIGISVRADCGALNCTAALSGGNTRKFNASHEELLGPRDIIFPMVPRALHCSMNVTRPMFGYTSCPLAVLYPSSDRQLVQSSATFAELYQ